MSNALKARQDATSDVSQDDTPKIHAREPNTLNMLPRKGRNVDSGKLLQARSSPSESLLNSYSPVTNAADISKAVLNLIGTTQQLQEDPTQIENINRLIDKLKHFLLQERQTYPGTRQNLESRKKLESLYNLIQYLELQAQRLQKAIHRRGLTYYLANISNKVCGNEIGRIGQSMESELQSWLNQQTVYEVAVVLSKRSKEEEQVKAISSFASVIQKGYNSPLQNTILSVGLVEKLAGSLSLGAAPWRVAKEAAFTLSALIDFNKNIFVSLVLMSNAIQNILRLMNAEPDDHKVLLISVINNMLSAGHTIVVDEIYAHDGVPIIVAILDHNTQLLQLAAMDCVFELTYYGRKEVVDTLFKLEVVKKLALLQQKYAAKDLCVGVDYTEENRRKKESYSLDMASSGLPPFSSLRFEDGQMESRNAFANAVTKFALHLAIGSGLRKREKRALKQELLRQIKLVMDDDTEVANITAEVLWAP